MILLNFFLIICLILGKDATEMFEDIGHSNEARKKMAEYLVGSLKVLKILFSYLL